LPKFPAQFSAKFRIQTKKTWKAKNKNLNKIQLKKLLKVRQSPQDAVTVNQQLLAQATDMAQNNQGFGIIAYVTFHLLDTDNDGIVEWDELSTGIDLIGQAFNLSTIQDADILSLAQAFDTDSNVTTGLDLQEFANCFAYSLFAVEYIANQEAQASAAAPGSGPGPNPGVNAGATASGSGPGPNPGVNAGATASGAVAASS